MPIRPTGDTETYIPCEIPFGPEHPCEWLFDQNHQPLKVLRRTKKGVFVKGTHGPITEIFFKGEGENRCIVTRVFDYAAAIEALDKRIEAVSFSDGIELTGGKIGDLIKDLQGKVNWTFETVEGDHTKSCWMKDEQGFQWGPLSLDPYAEKREWPFPGALGDVTLIPFSNRHGGRVEVLKGPFKMDLDGQDAHRFALNVHNTGDFEKSVTMMFPKGVRLDGGTVQG